MQRPGRRPRRLSLPVQRPHHGRLAQGGRPVRHHHCDGGRQAEPGRHATGPRGEEPRRVDQRSEWDAAHPEGLDPAARRQPGRRSDVPGSEDLWTTEGAGHRHGDVA